MSSRQTLALLVGILGAGPLHAQDGYLLFRGNLQRTSEAAKAATWDKRVAWQRPLLNDKLPGGMPDPDDDADKLIAKLRPRADAYLLPGSFPLIVKDQCVFRSHRDVRSVALQPFEIKDKFGDEKYAPGEIIWKSIPHDASLSRMLELKSRGGDMQRLIATLQAGKHEHWLWANPTVGSLSSDGVNLYAIDDLVFPSQDFKPGPLPPPFNSAEMSRFPKGNHLFAYDLMTGKLRWDTTYPLRGKSPFVNTHFLGAPIVNDGVLSVLNEKDGELRLLSIFREPKKWQNPGDPEIAKSVTLTKAPAGEQIAKSPLRRTQALHLAQLDDLLVCPTHAGLLIGVDRIKSEIRWQYRYRDVNTPAPAQPYWQAACPIIHKDRIVFTAADAPDVHCIDLNGKKKWTAPVENGLYLATVCDDCVLVVGKGICRALKLSDGTEKWKLEMGSPAGVGVKDGALYYLPLKKDAINDAATIWAIDLAKGTKAQRVPVPHAEALGNLALHRGLLISQSVTQVAAFPLGQQK